MKWRTVVCQVCQLLCIRLCEQMSVLVDDVKC